MTIVATLLDSGANNADATSYSTASLDPGNHPGRVVFLAFASIASITTTNPTSITGYSSTWGLVTSQSVNAGQRRTWLYRGISNASGAITVDYGIGNLQTGFQWGVVEFEKALVDFPVVQSNSSNGGGPGTSLNISLAGFVDSVHHVAYGQFHHAANESTTPETGFTELWDVSHASPLAGFEGEVFTGDFGATVDASWTTSSQRCGIACEVASAIFPGRSLLGVGR